MLKNKKSILNSLMVVGLSIAAVGCGSKVAGTYSLSQTGNSYYTQCSAVSLNVTENSNAVTATGSNGTCIENLSGIDNGGTITVSSFTISLTNSYSNSMPQCSYTGTLTVNNNLMTGTLTSTNASSSYYASMCAPISITGTKTN